MEDKWLIVPHTHTVYRSFGGTKQSLHSLWLFALRFVFVFLQTALPVIRMCLFYAHLFVHLWNLWLSWIHVLKLWYDGTNTWAQSLLNANRKVNGIKGVHWHQLLLVTCAHTRTDRCLHVSDSDILPQIRLFVLLFYYVFFIKAAEAWYSSIYRFHPVYQQSSTREYFQYTRLQLDSNGFSFRCIQVRAECW